MPDATLKQRIEAAKDWHDCCDISAGISNLVNQNCEGTLGECFLAGWTNAADMIEDGQLDQEDWNEVKRFVFSETSNMHGVG